MNKQKITRQRFYNYRELVKSINMQSDRLKEFIAKMDNPGTVKFSDIPKNHVINPDKIPHQVNTKISLENELKKMQIKKESEFKILSSAVWKLKKTEHIYILLLRYIDMYSWEDINKFLHSRHEDFEIEKNGKYERRMFRLHKTALNKIEKQNY